MPIRRIWTNNFEVTPAVNFHIGVKPKELAATISGSSLDQDRKNCNVTIITIESTEFPTHPEGFCSAIRVKKEKTCALLHDSAKVVCVCWGDGTPVEAGSIKPIAEYA